MHWGLVFTSTMKTIWTTMVTFAISIMMSSAPFIMTTFLLSSTATIPWSLPAVAWAVPIMAFLPLSCAWAVPIMASLPLLSPCMLWLYLWIRWIITFFRWISSLSVCFPISIIFGVTVAAAAGIMWSLPPLRFLTMFLLHHFLLLSLSLSLLIFWLRLTLTRRSLTVAMSSLLPSSLRL